MLPVKEFSLKSANLVMLNFAFLLAHLFSIVRVNVAKLQPLRNQRTALLNTLDRLLGTLMMVYRKTLCPGNLNFRFTSRFIGMVFYP